jgi:hypothetical protein
MQLEWGMNFAASLHQTDIPQRSAAGPSMFGWGISLLVHALAAAVLWHAWRPVPADKDTGPVRRIQVRLIAIAPAAPPVPVPDVAVPRSRPLQTRAAPGPTPPQRQARTRAVEAPPIITVPEPADSPVKPEEGSTAAPAVDLQAARAAARLIARENGKGLVALPGRKPVVDPNADRRVVDRFERARRVDCQKARAESTNLLANVIGLAVDLAKNAVDDSGCKW